MALNAVCPGSNCKTAGNNKNVYHWLTMGWLVSECVCTVSGACAVDLYASSSEMDQRPSQELCLLGLCGGGGGG